MTINEALDKYQATGCEVAFGEIYYHIYGASKRIIRQYASRYKLDEHDVESLINEKILLYAKKFDSTRGKFLNAIHRAIKNGCIDLFRKLRRKTEHETEVMYEDEEGSMTELYEAIAVAPTTGEDEIVEEVTKKHDQRQLIAFLLSNANEPTLTSASAFIKTDSYREAAKQIGTSDKTVKSRIRKLSQKYDERRFGNYYDYLTTPTIHVG